MCRTTLSIDETNPDRLNGGYAQSKWVAEKLITKASRCGLQVVIYRLGLICADSRSGACNQHDLYTLLFAQMMKMNCYPESVIHSHINGLPVDFTAKSIVYLSSVEEDLYGNIYHVINSYNQIRFEDIIDGMRRCDIRLDSVSNDEWKMKLKVMDDQKSDFQSVGKFFSDNTFRQRDRISADRFWSDVCTLHCPSFNKEYISKWLNFILNNIVQK